MSYSLIVFDGPECPTCKRCGAELFDWSPTYNYAPMWRAAGFSLRDFDGKTGAQVAVVLGPAVAAMEADPVRFRALEPANGWGTYDGAMPYLRDLLRIVTERPECVVAVL